MEPKRSWRQQIKIHPVRTVLITLLAVVIVLVILSILGYIFNWDWTGLNATDFTSTSQKITRTIAYQPEKTLWDWLQLLIIPAVLAVAGYVINLTISSGEQAATEQRAKSEREAAEKRAETEREIASDNQRETALQAYLDSMSELLLHENLRNSKLEDEVRKIARVRTLTALPRLDPKRKSSVLRFLIESNLIDNEDTIIDLAKADLSGVHMPNGYLGEINLHETNLSKAYLYDVILLGANLSKADLSEANLPETDLIGADLSGAILTGADLSGVILTGVNLSEANLQGTDLSKADLSGANLEGATGITIEELEKQTRSLKGATMPDGSIHP